MAYFEGPNKLSLAGYIADHHETDTAESEADLINNAIRCRKNPGHKDFIAVNDFALSHLPGDYHDNDIVEVIKATADLTVRINVTFVSPRRPDKVPGTDHSYPFHTERGSCILRTGTGRVWRISMPSHQQDGETCQCEKCQHSDTPNRVYGFIYVNTATHVVFDDAEARRTKCRFFFDNQDCPLVTANGCSVNADVVNDKCRLKLVTCDANLLKSLKELRKRWRAVRARVNEMNKARPGDGRLTFIVSHPHGCPKLISIGRCIREIEFRKTIKYTYTTCTCPGSSGALVYIVGCNDGLGYDGQIHSGVNENGENVSGIGGDRLSYRRAILGCWMPYS